MQYYDPECLLTHKPEVCRWGYGGLWAGKALCWAHHTICGPHMHCRCERRSSIWVGRSFTALLQLVPYD